MVKKLFFIFSILTIFCAQNVIAADDPFLFENFAIVDSGDADIITDSVSLDLDAASANVGSFDIAGIMLGMPFDDVQTLFFKTKSLYVPRKKDSIIYTMHKDWKYNLD
ncbi:MAG: hypothetical protein LBF37_02410, partial [Rickettsiales bacterium]|jgi:hypothetical protein|nr:hypothetical protein [Rickettsiales bacterium]